MANPYEDDWRTKKVEKLVAAFRFLGGDSASVRKPLDCEWEDAARVAGVNPPSDTTRAAVIAALEAREVKT